MSFEFMLKRRIPGKENTVDILGQTEAFFEKTPIIWNAAHDHVAFEDLMPVHNDIPGPDVFFAFFQRKRLQVYFAGKTIIQSALVVDDFAQHPGCYGAADDQQDIILINISAKINK